MKLRLPVHLCLMLVAVTVSAGLAEANELTFGDAYARGSNEDLVWTIGTESVEMTFDGREGVFRLVSFLNKTCEPPLEYVDAKTAAAPFALDSTAEANSQWTLKTGTARQVTSGGRPAVQLDVTLVRGDVLAQFHVLAFPGTSILRQWVDIENTGSQSLALKSPATASFQLRGDEATSYLNSWMVGGHVALDQGKMYQQPVASPYSHHLVGAASVSLVPWTALHRTTGPKDGLFLAFEYLGTWLLKVGHEATGPLTAAAGVFELKPGVLHPGQRLEMPWVTLGVFRDGLDNMAASLYDWQYEYLWDYTNPDFYARSRCPSWWFFCSQNLQEQFTARLAYLDMNTSDAMRTMGYEMLWDDAGWSSHPGEGLPPDGYGSVFSQTYEGPDFSRTQHYLRKTGMKWLLWFAGRPPAGVLDSKIGAWGDFEWRTDGVGFPNMAADKSFRAEVKRFLDVHPGSSFHTCSGGSTYSHTFEIGGRYSSYNYLSDLGRGPHVNHFFSYLEPPDKWGDILVSLASIYGKKDGSTASMAEVLAARGGATPKPEDLRYVKDSGRGMLTGVPSPYWGQLPPEDTELARQDMELYRFFRDEGLAGRWSYAFHPAVQGDPEYYYFQRTSHDRRKACIILTHRAENPVTVCPRGLLPEATYVVGFDSTQETSERTGADLMASGIAIKDQKPGELIYLNLPHRPGSGQDTVPPQAPGRVLVRRETNIGHGGIGVYWAPGTDNTWISYYEVRRDATILNKAAIGNYYFDHAAGWGSACEYAVRTIDGDGNASDWRLAEPGADEPITFAALGGHFAEAGRDGWSAETSTNGQDFTPMAWVPPAKNPAADFGGTPTQRGGVEGYWESTGAARVGRGWQQASPTDACVRTWTAPKAGTVRIAGRAMREYYHRTHGGPLRVKVLHGQKQIWPERDWADVAVGDLTGVAHNIKVTVATGDPIRFVLDKGSVPEHDLIAWMPRIVYADPEAVAPAFTPVRILCGAATPYTDHSGNVWAADQHFAGGKSLSTTESIENASPTPKDQVLYQNGRAGRDFSYSIPVPTGLYTVRLKFAEPKHPWMFERPFELAINGQEVLTDFDIVQAAKGPRRAVERSFRNIVSNADGNIVLHFSAGTNPRGASDDAIVQAIEILPEQRPVIRINAGSEAGFVDWNSCVWTTDAHFTGGTALKSDAAVVHASPTLYDQELYRTARSAKALSYTLAAPPGLYTVHLKFAELWLATPGERPMDIAINGRLVRKSWDPAAAAGRIGMAVDIRINNITPDKEGHIAISLHATGANEAILQAIEIE
jgi:malectin (di-glucose binding ER protein)